MNYYITYDNQFYNVVNSESNSIIASFVEEIEAKNFLQSLILGPKDAVGAQVSANNQVLIDPFSIRTTNNIIQPNTIPNSAYFLNQGINYIPPYYSCFNYPLSMNFMCPHNQGFLIPNNNICNFNPYIPANNMSNIQPNYQHSFMSQNPNNPVNKNLESGVLISNDKINQILENEQHSKNNKLIKEKEFENEVQKEDFLFDDNNFTLDSNLLDEDKQGAIIYNQKNFINNTDDDSLGEMAAYKNIEPLNNEVKNSNINNNFNNIEKEEFEKYKSNFNKKVIDDLSTSSKNITELYEENLIPDNKITTRKDDDIIDLGPIAEEDDIFSTPRKDAEQDDFETYTLSKKERAELKKAKKKDEKARKKYQKMMK